YCLLIALGLSLIFSLGGIVNLAHGAFYAIGAYLTTLIAPQLGYGGALILSPITVAILGIFLERYFFRRGEKKTPTGKPVSGPLVGLKCKSACKRGQAGMLQVFSSFVAAITSRLSLAAGTGSLGL
ncbi:MAG: hypothetical protein EBW58_08120, partial [Betaproteobacteria bacterium]|nr:hypothetical protein [Betaproteobacteria bacterium]